MENPSGAHRLADRTCCPVTLPERAAVAALAALALIVRLLPWAGATAGGDFLISQPDALYHVRRVTLILHSFPRIAGLDHYLSYPYGSECPWPPLYDLFQAGLAVLAGGLHPSPAVVHGVNSLLPPVLAALTIFPVHRLARRLGGRAAGLVGAALFVALPIHLQYSLIGSGDHHTAEVFLLASFLAVFLGPLPRRDGPRGRRAAFLSGLILGSAVLVWQGSIVFAGVLVAGVFVTAIQEILGNDNGRMRGEASDAVDRAILALATSTALVAAFRAVYPSESEQTVFDFGFFSWFQPAVLLCGTLMLLLLRYAGRTGGGERRRKLALVALSVGLAVALPMAVPAWRENLLAALQFLMAADPWLSTIIEFWPLCWDVFFGGWDSLPLLPDRVFLLMLPMPIIAASAAFLRAWRRGEPLLERSLLLACAAIIGVLAIVQRRWVNAHTVNIAICGGWAAAKAFETARERIMAASGGGVPRRVLLLAAGILPGAVLFLPAAYLVSIVSTHPETLIRFDRYAPLSWLRDHTPRTAGLWGGGKRPEYSVLAPWSYGHMVLSIGERPTIVGNFGTQLRGGGIADLARFYYAGDEGEVAALFDRRGIRYLVLPDPFSEVRAMAPVIGIDFESVYTVPIVDPGGVPRREFNARFFALPVVGLYSFDGGLYPSGPALTRFRLVHESAILNPIHGGAEAVKIFEYVKGARLQGRTRSGKDVFLSCRLRTEGGRAVIYTSRARADAEGRFSILFPYATRGANGGTVAEGRASAATDSGSVGFDVAEEDVLEGRIVALPRVP